MSQTNGAEGTTEQRKELVTSGDLGEGTRATPDAPDDQTKRKDRRRRKRLKPTGTLNDRVKSFVESLELDFPARFKHRAKDMKKRVVQLLNYHMPPHPKRPGKRQSPSITQALHLWEQQTREMKEGKREKLDWIAIATDSIPEFPNIKSGWRRKEKIRNLRNAVSQRRARQNWAR